MSFIRVARLTSTVDMTHSYVWHYSCTSANETCAWVMSHIWMSRVPRRISCITRMNESCVTLLIHTGKCRRHLFMSTVHQVPTCNTCDMTHPYVWHGLFTCDMTPSCVRNDKFIRVTCWALMCDAPRESSHVWTCIIFEYMSCGDEDVLLSHHDSYFHVRHNSWHAELFSVMHYVQLVNKSYHTYECVTSHIVLSHMWMIDVTYA